MPIRPVGVSGMAITVRLAWRGARPKHLAQLAALPAGAPEALREYLHGDYLMLYTATDADATMYLLSIRHHRKL